MNLNLRKQMKKLQSREVSDETYDTVGINFNTLGSITPDQRQHSLFLGFEPKEKDSE